MQSYSHELYDLNFWIFSNFVTSVNFHLRIHLKTKNVLFAKQCLIKAMFIFQKALAGKFSRKGPKKDHWLDYAEGSYTVSK